MSQTIRSRFGIYITSLAGASLILLSACSWGVPSESVGRKVLENAAAKEGVYRVNSFTKTNGVLDPSGTTYQLEFEAEVECKKVNREPYSSSGVFNYTFPLIEPGSLYVSCEEVGKKQRLKDVLRFQKTEKGWRGRDGEVY